MCDFEKQKFISKRMFENVIAKRTVLCPKVFKEAIIKSKSATIAFFSFPPRSFLVSHLFPDLQLIEPQKT